MHDFELAFGNPRVVVLKKIWLNTRCRIAQYKFEDRMPGGSQMAKGTLKAPP